MAGFLPVCHKALLQMHHSHKSPAGFHLLLLSGLGFQGHPEGNSSSCHSLRTVPRSHPRSKSGHWYPLSFPAGYGIPSSGRSDSWFVSLVLDFQLPAFLPGVPARYRDSWLLLRFHSQPVPDGWWLHRHTGSLPVHLLRSGLSFHVCHNGRFLCWRFHLHSGLSDLPAGSGCYNGILSVFPVPLFRYGFQRHRRCNGSAGYRLCGYWTDALAHRNHRCKLRFLLPDSVFLLWYQFYFQAGRTHRYIDPVYLPCLYATVLLTGSFHHTHRSSSFHSGSSFPLIFQMNHIHRWWCALPLSVLRVWPVHHNRNRPSYHPGMSCFVSLLLFRRCKRLLFCPDRWPLLPFPVHHSESL